MFPRFVLLGPPASGKGTQGRRLAGRLGLAYLSTGALLRSAVGEDSPLGRAAAPILARHEYLPDSLMCPIMGEWLARQPAGWVLDGFPRSVAQAEFLAAWLERHGQALSAAILLEVPEDELLRRIRDRVECPGCRWSGRRDQLIAGSCPECGSPAGPRDDDSEVGFRSRLAEYREHVLPVIDLYQKQGLLRRFDAASDPSGAERRLLELTSISHGPPA
jgi:adenylate kinase